MSSKGPMNPKTTASEVFSANFEKIDSFVEILTGRGIEWGLLGPREADRVWERHILNCVAVADLIPQNALVGDIGSGAGLPGIPLAILRPDLKLVLIESMERRVNFLRLAVAELDLDDQVSVIRTRAEDDDGCYDVVTCRAVAPLEKLILWTTPLFYPDGQLLAIKGSSADEEVSNSSQLLKRYQLSAEVLDVQAHPEAQATKVIRVRAR